MDAFFFRSGILDKLKCPRCKEYMRVPITQCCNGHNICDVCRENFAECSKCGEAFVTQNCKLENILEATRFPCINVMFGCPETMVVSKLQQHASVCLYHLYECPVGKRGGCSWRGGKNLIAVHIQEKHKEVHWIKEERSIVVLHNFDLPKEMQDCQILQAYGEIFVFHQHFNATDKKVKSAVQYIGPGEEAKKFLYKVMYASVISPEKVSMTCTAHTASEDSETILSSKDCACIEFRKLKMLVHDHKVKFEIKVKKVENLIVLQK